MPETGEHTFATQLRQLRGEMTLRELARRANCSKSTIWDLEHERRAPTPQIAQGLDNALGADGKLVLLAHAHQQRLSEETTTPHDGVAVLLREWDDVLRRDFCKNSAGALSATMVANLGIGTASANSRELMDAHRALRAAHGRLDNLRGASSVYAQAVTHHQQVLTWHATARNLDERKAIAGLASDTGGFVGFLSWDLGMPAAAATHYRDAASYAHQSGDLSSAANLIGQMSRVLFGLGHHRRALNLSDGALELAATKAHPAVRSWLHAVRAHHHAGLGHVRASQADLSTAWNLLSRADDGEKPPYIGYLDEAEIGKWTGHAMSQLGRATPSCLDTGRSALDEARATWPSSSVRGSAEILTVSARIYAAGGHRDEAEALASRAVAIATATGSARNLRAALAAQAKITVGNP